MSDWIRRIEELDLSLFDGVPSQTSAGDRRSLLAVQRAIARAHQEYVYLEIGSHLGGTIQPHLADPRCKQIYSIDPRPPQQPDDRSPGHVAVYGNNSSERMLGMLEGAGLGDVRKIECIELDASQVEPGSIRGSPRIAFIDGEHTKKAVISDFHFCSRIISQDGVVLFHDFSIVYPAILEICDQLSQQDCPYLPVKLEGGVFAIFFDGSLLTSEPYLSSLYRRTGRILFIFRAKAWLKRALSRPAVAPPATRLRGPIPSRCDDLGGHTIMGNVKPIPDGVSVVMPMLVCRDASAEVDFCKATFGAVELVRRPGPDGTVAHAALAIGGATIMIEGEFPTLAGRAPRPDGSSPVVIYVYVEHVDAAIERAVAAGARILIPVKNQFWGDRTGRVVDPSGHVWTLSTRVEETSSAEREDRWSSILKR